MTDNGTEYLPVSRVGTSDGIFSPTCFGKRDEERILYKFRLAPEPPAKKWRPWNPEEVPVGAQTKTKVCDSEIQMIVGRNLLGVLLAQDNGAYPFRDMLELRLHSLDNGKTWLPCGVGVGA